MAKKAKPAVEVEETEETATGRGPTALHEAMAEWLNETYDADITADQVRLAQTKRKEFRATEAYDTAVSEMDEAREQAETEKAKRRAAKEAQAEEAEEAPAPKRRKAKAQAEDADEAPAPKRGRKAKAAAEEPAEETEAKPARRGRKAKAAATTEAAEEETSEAPAKPKRRRAAF